MKRSQEDLIFIIQEIINEIEENLDSLLSVKDFAARSGYSVWQFQRIFRSMVGDTLGHYLRGRKLTVAAEKLLNIDQKIIDIALEYQFGSQEAFSRAFKAHFGKTPKKVRDEKPNLIINQKPKLTLETLKHINGGIETRPRIVELPERKYVGLEIDMPSHLEAAEKIIPLLVSTWLEFNKRKNEIKHRVGKTSFGIAKSEGKFNEENMMRYLSAVEVTDFEEIPEGAAKKWKKIGVVRFTESETSNSCDHRLHFPHPKWKSDLKH